MPRRSDRRAPTRRLPARLDRRRNDRPAPASRCLRALVKSPSSQTTEPNEDAMAGLLQGRSLVIRADSESSSLMGAAEFSPRHVIADQRGEGGEQFVLIVRRCSPMPGTVGSRRVPHRSCCLAACPPKSRAPAGWRFLCGHVRAPPHIRLLVECLGQARGRLVYSAAASGVDRGLLVGLDGSLVMPCVLEMACYHTPVGLDEGRRVDQRVGSARVQVTTEGWRGQLGSPPPGATRGGIASRRSRVVRAHAPARVR